MNYLIENTKKLYRNKNILLHVKANIIKHILISILVMISVDFIVLHVLKTEKNHMINNAVLLSDTIEIEKFQQLVMTDKLQINDKELVTNLHPEFFSISITKKINNNTIVCFYDIQYILYINLLLFGIIFIVWTLSDILNTRKIINDEQHFHNLLAIAGSKILHNMVATYISENIHHEMLTPLKTIATKIRIMDEMSQNDNKIAYITAHDEIKFKSDITHIKLALETIYEVLNNIKESRLIKKNDIKKDVIETIKYVLDVLKIIRAHDVSLEFDKILANIFISSAITEQNAVNIFLVQIKNIIDSLADSIYIKFINLNNGFLTIHLEDDGNELDALEKDMIFDDLEFDMHSTSRTNGLMIARDLLRRHNGDIKFISSESGKTIFEIVIPVELHTKKSFED